MSKQEGSGALLGNRWIILWCAGLMVVGMISRLAPLADPHGRLLRQFMSEDGYLMQIVARNMAIGLGMSVSDGTIQTNGVQPLATFLFSFFYLVAGGDKVGGVAGVQAFSAVISLAAAIALYRLARVVLSGLPDGRTLAAMVASLWFASPLIVKHSMNGLETGLYLFVTTATMLYFANAVERSPVRFSLRQMICLGVLFGLCFLVRNDAIFLIAAILIARFVLLWPRDLHSLGWRIWEGTVPGMLSLLIALPWLVYNYRLFGSIVPISGIAESLNVRLGHSLITVPATIFEYVAVILTIPRALESSLLTISLSVVLTAIAVVLSASVLRTQSGCGPYLMIAYGLFSIEVITFYGVYFGADHFIPRYLSILSPYLALLGITAGYRAVLMLADRLRLIALRVAAALAALVVIGVNGIIYRNGLWHQHMHVVEWVSANIPKYVWVGAPQSGTLGFFHDRTVNLDGKVDPMALRAIVSDGRLTSYVLKSDIVYLADTYPLSGWATIEKDGFNRKFELIIADKRADLAVLRRVSSSTPRPTN